MPPTIVAVVEAVVRKADVAAVGLVIVVLLVVTPGSKLPLTIGAAVVPVAPIVARVGFALPVA
jgi:hypothetical protein